MPSRMYCTAVSRSCETFSSRPNINNYNFRWLIWMVAKLLIRISRRPVHIGQLLCFGCEGFRLGISFVSQAVTDEELCLIVARFAWPAQVKSRLVPEHESVATLRDEAIANLYRPLTRVGLPESGQVLAVASSQFAKYNAVPA